MNFGVQKKIFKWSTLSLPNIVKISFFGKFNLKRRNYFESKENNVFFKAFIWSFYYFVYANFKDIAFMAKIHLKVVVDFIMFNEYI